MIWEYILPKCWSTQLFISYRPVVRITPKTNIYAYESVLMKNFNFDSLVWSFVYIIIIARAYIRRRAIGKQASVRAQWHAHIGNVHVARTACLNYLRLRHHHDFRTRSHLFTLQYAFTEKIARAFAQVWLHFRICYQLRLWHFHTVYMNGNYLSISALKNYFDLFFENSLAFQLLSRHPHHSQRPRHAEL